MKKLILISFVILSSYSCDNLGKLRKDLNGKWEMISYVSFLPSLPIFNKNEVVWTFDVSKRHLFVTNNVESKYPFLLESGSYDIKMHGKTILISNILYEFSVKNGVLTISDRPELDGPVMKFTAD